MTVSHNPGSYRDCYAVMDAAVSDSEGVRLRMRDEDAATYFRMRCHTARKIDRDQNLYTYTKGDPLYGISIYDQLRLSIRIISGEAWLYFTQYNTIPGEIESLSGSEVVASLPARILPKLPGTYPGEQVALPPPMDNESLGAAFDGIEAIDRTEVIQKPEPGPTTTITIRRLR